LQEKIQKISPIKQRILQFIANENISQRFFYAKTEISRGTLSNTSSITEEILAKFIANYPNINPDWLLTGKGTMLRDHSPVERVENREVSEIEQLKKENSELKDRLVKSQARIIELLDKMQP